MSIEAEIRKNIAQNGHISIDQFMEIAMSKYSKSYYRSTNPIGKDQDFITAPELSQMFGEMIAIWCIDLWHKLGKPKSFNIVEYGAGLGTLIKMICNASKYNVEFLNALNIYIIEINPKLKNHQSETLQKFLTKIKWIKSLSEINNNCPTIIIANEFFDALPVKQYIKVKTEWKERVISINPINGTFTFDTRNINKILEEQFAIEHQNALDGAILEESPISIKLIREIANFIALSTGAALIIDYGYEINTRYRKSTQYLDTLQAIKNHRYSSVLEKLGESDLSSHVDFYALKNAAKLSNVEVYGTISQRKLLKDCGIDLRLQILIDQNPDMKIILKNQYDRLVDVTQMGELFKVITITSSNQIIPIGFI